MDRLAAEVDGDRELPRGHLEQRGGRRTEFFVSDEFLHAQRRGHDDETQRGDARASLHRELRAQRHDAGEETQEDVGVDAALVRLVDDDHAVLAEEQIRLNLPKQDAVRHELDARLVPDALIVTHLVPDVAAQGDVQLRGDARGGGRHRHAPGLRHRHRARMRRARGVAVPGFVQKLRHLRRLTATGLAADDHDGIRVDGVHDVVLRAQDGKTLAHLLYVVQAGHGHGVRRADEHTREFRRRRRRRRLVRRRELRRRILRIDRRSRRRGTQRLDGRLRRLFGVALANLRGEFARRRERESELLARLRVRRSRLRVVVVVVVVAGQRGSLRGGDAFGVESRLVEGVYGAVGLLGWRGGAGRAELRPAGLASEVVVVVGAGRVVVVVFVVARVASAAARDVARTLALGQSGVLRAGEGDSRALGLELAAQGLALAHALAHAVASLEQREGLVADQLGGVEPRHHPRARLALALVLLDLRQLALLRFAQLLLHGGGVRSAGAVLSTAAAAGLARLLLLCARQHGRTARRAELRGELGGEELLLFVRHRRSRSSPADTLPARRAPDQVANAGSEKSSLTADYATDESRAAPGPASSQLRARDPRHVDVQGAAGERRR